jgi:hypothetical protein
MVINIIEIEAEVYAKAKLKQIYDVRDIEQSIKEAYKAGAKSMQYKLR